jgi:hypothetical protein
MGLRGTSRSCAPWGRVDQWPCPRGLRLSFGDSIRFALPLFRTSSGVGLEGLPLSVLRDLGSSHGVVKVPPLHRHRCLVSTPGESAAPKSNRAACLRGDQPCGTEPLSARSCHLPDSFRPCRSSRLRRFAPPGTFQVCCTLKPILGFARFQVFGAHLIDLRVWFAAQTAFLSRVVSFLPEGIPVATPSSRSLLVPPERSAQAPDATW